MISGKIIEVIVIKLIKATSIGSPDFCQKYLEFSNNLEPDGVLTWKLYYKIVVETGSIYWRKPEPIIAAA